MHPSKKDVRCKGCGTLLAKREREGLAIVRNGLQATFDGQFRATIVCYMPSCRTLNIVEFPTSR